MTAVEPATGTPARPSRRVSWVALGVAVVLAGFFVILAIAKPDEGDQLGPQVKNFAAPTLVTETIDGTPFDLSQHRGRWVVLNFIASWCVPCKQEHPELVAFVAQRTLGADAVHCVTALASKAQKGRNTARISRNDADFVNNGVELIEDSAIQRDFFARIVAGAENWDGRDPIRQGFPG